MPMFRIAVLRAARERNSSARRPLFMAEAVKGKEGEADHEASFRDGVSGTAKNQRASRA